ncbi:hypothetical protein [Micromonospora cremea]|uniref:Uncharacterized protein n=1 Tax=Micromonospora cremea TaxID=709881 RepID=A0A1N6A2Y9_9ACTN|nr:hypothetical protein [Micromonospora cremea]SIN28436.1 hypothetical protein SAMN04489832_4841 [Micromonospora cremea]
MLVEPAAARAPLGRRPRTLFAAAIVIAVIVPSLVIRELVEARFGRGPLADLSAIAVPVVVTARLAPRASYRRRDALLWLVGPGIYIFAVIAWRLALLPYRDWKPRPEEVPRMRWLRGPEHAGMWHLPTDDRQSDRPSASLPAR